MKHAITTRDARLVVRIVNLAHRFGCWYTSLHSKREGNGYTATIEIDGPSESLRRLDLQVNKLLLEYKEHF